MAQYIETAKVLITPSTVGFEASLREQLKPILAKPFKVTVVPVTKGFTTAIRKAIGTTPIAVPITPSGLREFDRAVNRMATAAKVGAVPDINIPTFKAALQAQVDTAAAGVVAAVPAVPVGAAGAGAGAAAAEITALQAAIDRLTASLTKQAAAQTAVTKGSAAQGAATKKLTTEADFRKKIAEQQAIVEKALLKVQNASLPVQTRSEALSIANAKSKVALAAALELSTFAVEEESLAYIAEVDVMQARLVTEKANIDAAVKRAAQTVKAAEIQKTFNVLQKESVAVLRVETQAVITEAEAKAQASLATKLSTRLKTLETAATKAQATVLADQISKLRASTVAYAAEMKARAAALASVAKAEEKARAAQIAQGKTAAGQLRFARRGAAATALSLLGIRGATLASTGAFLAGAAAASIFALSVKSAADLEQELNVFKETAGATADEMDRVRQTAEDLGRDIRLPGISAAQAAEAMTGLAKAGLSVQDSIAGATGVLQLSIAANLDLARSTEIVASALNAFGLSGNEAIRVADVLANSANLAQGSIDDMGIAMQQASAVGRQAGLSFEDTATFLTLLARAGLRGSDAGTSLRTGLIRLINPTVKAQKILDKLNVTIRDTAGNIRPEIFQNLAAATAGMTKAQRDQTIAQLAGNDAVRAFNIIMRVTTPELIKFRQENRKVGSAAALTEARAKGLAGAARGLGSNLQTAGISIGRYATPALQNFVEGLNAAVLSISQSSQVRETLTQTLGAVGAGFSTLGATLSAIAPALLAIAEAAQFVTSAIGAAPLLAAFAAWKLAPKIFIAVTAAIGPVKAAVLNLTETFAIWRLYGLSRTESALRTFSGEVLGGTRALTLYTIGITAAAAGLVYLITRESATERATRHLKETTEELTQALTDARTSTQDLATAQAQIGRERLAVITAQLAAAQARANLQASTAAKNSLERQQLENALAVAVQDVTFAQQRYRDAISGVADAQERASDAARKARELRSKEVADIQILIEQARHRGLREVPIIGTGELGALPDVIKALRERAEATRELDTAEARSIAKRLELLANLAEMYNKIPSQRVTDIIINTPNLTEALGRVASEFGITGLTATTKFAKGWTTGLQAARRQLLFALDDLHVGIVDSWGTTGYASGDAFTRGVANGIAATQARIDAAVADLTGKLQDQQLKLLEAQAAGASISTQLAIQRGLLATQKGIVAKAKAKFQKTGLEADRQAYEDALAEQIRIQGEIESLLGEIQSNAEEHQRKVEKAISDADEATLKTINARIARRTRLVEMAGTTEPLRDDILLNKKLLDLYNALIKSGLKNIKDLELRAATLKDIKKQRDAVRATIKELVRQQKEDIEASIRETFELDISFFSTTENRRGEIRARQRFINYLRKLQADTKKGTVEYKRLRNEIAEQQKAIDDLKKQEKDRRDAWTELTWEFMQTQQGFAANLLGNLIPLGASMGLVGGQLPQAPPSGMAPPVPNLSGSAAAGFGGGLGEALINQRNPGSLLLQAQGRAAGVSQPPMGRDQGSIEIQLLQTIASILGRMERGSRHPEARRARVSQDAAYDMLLHGAAEP